MWSTDARGGVIRIAPDATQTFVTDTERAMFSDADDEEMRFTEGTLANGLACAGNGGFLIANFGTDLLERMAAMQKPKRYTTTSMANPWAR